MNKKKRGRLSTIGKIFWIAITSAPLWILLDCLAMLLSAVCYAFSTVVKQCLFDTITDVTVGNETFRTLILVTVLVVIFQIGNELLNAVCNFTWSPAMKAVVGRLKQKIHLKIASLPGNDFEDVQTLENIEKANVGADKCYNLYNAIATILLFYVPYFLVLGIYLWSLEPALTLSLVFIFIPLVVNLFIKQKIFERQLDETIPLAREKDYYETELFNRDTLKENRLYGTFSFFERKFRTANNEYCEKRWKSYKKSTFIDILMKCFVLVGYLGVIILILFMMMNQSISVGAFAAIFSSITTLISFMNDAIGNHLGSVFEDIGPLKKYLEVMDFTEEPVDEDVIIWSKGVEVSHLSYSYPNTNKKVIDDVSFGIKPGETIALVGENGVGKSTLVRLLLGILHPDTGNVVVEGRIIHKINPEGRFQHVSAVFQKFIKYQMTLKDNIQISAKESDQKRFQESIQQSEFEVDDRFTQGENTILAKEFGGIELSGGQWQRVAIARGLYRDSQFMVLDEPTSAIDPIEEGVLYRKFKEIIQDKMGVIVTHRLGSTKIADRILVMHNGKIVEQGTHDELINENGRYAQMYHEQAKWYETV